MAKNHGPSIKYNEQYEALREKGYKKSTAAAIANTPKSDIDHDGRAYEDRTKEELYQLARELEIEGRSKMYKAELIEALRENR